MRTIDMAGENHVICLRGVFLGALKIIFKKKKSRSRKSTSETINTTDNNIHDITGMIV
jgi:hypothetical protein